MLVLHDPTTAVDSVTELNIAEGLLELRHGTDPRTTIVLTSSPALLAAADRVIVIDDGRVIAAETHHRLAETDAVYQTVVVR